MRFMIARLLAAGLGISALTACGTPETAVEGTGSTHAPVTITAPNPQQFDGPAFTREVISEVAQAWSNTRTLSFDLNSYSLTMAGQVGTNRSHISFSKPNRNAITVLSSSDSRTTGTKLVWLGGSSIEVHTQFIGFWITATVDLHDARATDNRGYFVDETNVTALMETFLDPRAQVQFKGMGTMNGVRVAAFDVVSPRRLKTVAREVITIDELHKMPVMREMYDAQNKLVYRISLDNTQLNPTLSADAFKAN